MVLDLLARHTFSDLVARGKEGAVGERADQDGGYGDASQEHVEDDDLKSHGFQGVCASDDHADHCAWKEDDPRGLRGVYQGDEGALEGRLEDGGYGLAAGGSEGEGGLDLGPLLSQVVADTGQRQAGGVHGVADHHAPEWDQVARRRAYHPKREQQTECCHRCHPHGESNHPESTGDVLGPARRGPGGEEDHPCEQERDGPDALEPEDEVYDVAYGDEPTVCNPSILVPTCDEPPRPLSLSREELLPFPLSHALALCQ